MEELSQQTKNLLEQEKKPIQEDTFFDKYIAGEKTKGMFNPTARDVVDTATDFIPGVSETKDIISLGTNVGKGEYKAAGIDLASLVLGVVPVVGDVARKGFRALVKNEDIVSKQADEVGESLQKIVGDVKPPEKTVKAYKLFKTDKKGNLYPLFVKMKDNKPLELNKWTKAEAGELNPKTGKVKSSLGDLAYRPGFHGGDLPIATHIGGKKGKVTKPNYRKDNQVWAEVEFGNDVDWQSIANSRAVRNKDGSVQVKTAHITDQVPERGHYRYKTNPNMTGNWLIGGELKINRVLSDKEVKSINDKAGVADLPRLKDLNLKESKKLSKGGDSKMDEDIKDKDLKEAVEAKSDDAIGVADTQLTNLSRQELMNELYRRGRTPEDIMNQTNLTGPELEALVTLGEGKAKGGVAQQMELFSEGGLKDEGGTVDPVSGNDVPPGSTQEEVRDDIPAQLSEGEFVFPADVVRFLGLNFLMELRQKAKAGLKRMEEMGQMGNSDEATLPDDIPFTMEDLDIAEDAQDNVIEANIGTFVPPRFRQSNVYSPTANPYAPTGVVPTIYAPATAKPTGETQGLLGASAQGAPETENRRYVNKETNQVRFIPFIKGTNQSLYPIPKGFVPQAETVTEPAPKEKTTRVQTAKVKSVDAGDDGDTTTGDLGGARTTIGGVEYAVQYNFDGTVGLQSLDNYKATGQRNFQIATPAVASAIKSQTLGQLTQLGKVAGLQGFAVAELAKKTTGIDIIPSKIDQLIKDGKKATSVLNKVKPASIFDVSRTLDRDITKSTDLSLTSRPDYISSEEFEKTRDFYEKEFGEGITGRGIEGTGITQKELSDIQKSLEDNTVSETGKGATAGGETAPTPSLSATGVDYSTPSAVASASSFGDEPGDDTDTSPSGDPGGGFGGSSAGDFGFTATGGLMNKKKIIMKKKPKPKKMKRGGLASR